MKEERKSAGLSAGGKVEMEEQKNTGIIPIKRKEGETTGVA